MQVLRGVVLVGALAVVVLMILLLWQMNTHVARLDERTGVLQEQITGSQSAEGPPLQSSVRDVLPTLQRVRRQLGRVSAATSDIRLLRSVDDQLGTLERNTALIAALPALLDQIRALRADTGQIGALGTRLDGVSRQLHAVQRSVGALPPILDDMRGHLENIDKKTGPAPPTP